MLQAWTLLWSIGRQRVFGLWCLSCGQLRTNSLFFIFKRRLTTPSSGEQTIVSQPISSHLTGLFTGLSCYYWLGLNAKIGGFQVRSLPSWWTKTKDPSLATFVQLFYITSLCLESIDWLQTIYHDCVKELLKQGHYVKCSHIQALVDCASIILSII